MASSGILQSCNLLLPPNTRQPPGSAGACARSGHLAVLLAGRPSRRRVPAPPQVAAPEPRPLEVVAADRASKSAVVSRDTKLRGMVGKFYEVEMMVDDCDLDQFGVVNNAVYAAYIDKAREAMLSSFGISRDSIAGTGRAMAVSDLNLRYFAPLKRGAKFVVMVRPVRIKGVRILAEHFIETLPERKLVLEATATAVFLDQDYRPTRVFPEMSKLLHFFSS
ncbi:hypothetical protein ACP4OV_000480 [Aristida adscensionis]